MNEGMMICDRISATLPPVPSESSAVYPKYASTLGRAIPTDQCITKALPKGITARPSVSQGGTVGHGTDSRAGGIEPPTTLFETAPGLSIEPCLSVGRNVPTCADQFKGCNNGLQARAAAAASLPLRAESGTLADVFLKWNTDRMSLGAAGSSS